MLRVLSSTWALLLGVMLLMVGNGLQASLIGIRGSIEQFSTTELSVITSAYFAGFLIGSRVAPNLIHRVGHVRVFAALGSFISAVLILYPTITDPWTWVALRVVFGFSFSGVYVTAESWLNNASDNQNRGKALSLYVMAQMLGIVLGQGLLNVADPAGFVLFVIPSVLVSLAFAPILLTASKSPAFETTKPMSLRQLYNVSPLGFVGMFLLGAVFAAQFGMASIYGTEAGFSVAEISIFFSAIFLGGMTLQYPLGWLSDRMDRRVLIFAAAIGGGVAGIIGIIFGDVFEVVLVVAFFMGGMSNPLYALLIAYTNDYLATDDMAAASGGLIFLSGLGAVSGPMLVGWVMTKVGPSGFWIYLATIMLVLAAYAAYRMTQRASAYREEDDYDAVKYAHISPTATHVAVEAAQEYYAENVDTEGEQSSSETEHLDPQ